MIDDPPSDNDSLLHTQRRDHGKRRHLSYARDFDTRAVLLQTKIQDHWEERVKNQWVDNHRRIQNELKAEFGEWQFVRKLENFIAIDTKPFSIIAYHNAFFSQVRNAFIIGSYYPALTGACSLGERILNHLVIDLREDFRSHGDYKRVYRKKSFSDWEVAIEMLEAWSILLPEVATEFRALQSLRHNSIHFNESTYKTVRDDALAAILHLRTIIEHQFGAWGTQPWYIEGTIGHVFVKKAYETHPFIRRYFLRQAPFVGPLFAIQFSSDGSSNFFDIADYGEGSWSDEEFKSQFNNRSPDEVVKPSD